MVKVGDKVKLDYISDCNPHNNKVGEVIRESMHKYYPTGNVDEFVLKQSCIIQYLDGSTEQINDTERKGGGVVSPVEKVA